MDYDYIELDIIKKAVRLLKLVEAEQAYQNGFSIKYPQAKEEMLDKIIAKANAGQDSLFLSKTEQPANR